jgi:hypothetical protein
MSDRYYKIIPAADASAAMANPLCVTTWPRLSLDDTKALLKYTEQVPGSVTHAEIMVILQTSDWSVNLLAT